MIYSITEGQQAEEYKLRKAREKLEYQEKDKNQARDSDSIGYKTPKYSTISGERSNSKFASGYRKQDQAKMDKDITNKGKAVDIFNRELVRRTADTSGKLRKLQTDEDGDYTGKTYRELERAADATLRHVRRHPEQYKESCGLFSNISFI